MSLSIKAGDLIHRDAATMSVDLSVDEAIAWLHDNRTSSAPVVRQDNELVGNFSESDALRYLSDQYYYQRFSDQPAKVADLMRPHPFCISENVDLFTLASLFLQHRYRKIPVVDHQGRLQGVIRRRDVLQKMTEMMDQHQREEQQKRQRPDIHNIVNHRFLLGG